MPGRSELARIEHAARAFRPDGIALLALHAQARRWDAELRRLSKYRDSDAATVAASALRAALARAYESLLMRRATGAIVRALWLSCYYDGIRDAVAAAREEAGAAVATAQQMI